MISDRVILLRKIVRIGREMREYKRLEYERSVKCKICRDYYLLKVKYLDKKGIDKSGEFRCDCEGARASGYHQYKSISLLLEEIEYLVCGCCSRVFRAGFDSDLITRPCGYSAMEPICSECAASTTFEDELKKKETELAAFESPQISGEEMMRRFRQSHGQNEL